MDRITRRLGNRPNVRLGPGIIIKYNYMKKCTRRDEKYRPYNDMEKDCIEARKALGYILKVVNSNLETDEKIQRINDKIEQVL